jgi:hypothetical protein
MSGYQEDILGVFTIVLPVSYDYKQREKSALTFFALPHPQLSINLTCRRVSIVS